MTSFEDDLVRRVLERTPQPGPADCPDEGDLAAWAEDRADDALRAHVEDHLARCDACRDLALGLRDELPRASEASAPAAAGIDAARSSRSVRWAVAAAVLVAAGASLAFVLGGRGTEAQGTDARLLAAVDRLRAVDAATFAGFAPITGEERRGSPADVTRSGLLLREPAGIVGSQRPRFAWTTAVPAESVEVTVVQTDGTEVWKRGLSGDALPYPPDAPPLEPGRDYVVEIAVRGATHATSASRAFRVASAEEAERRHRTITVVEREAPRDLADLVAAQALARQGWWLEAEMRARRFAETNPGDAVGLETRTWIRRHLGWPTEEPR